MWFFCDEIPNCSVNWWRWDLHVSVADPNPVSISLVSTMSWTMKRTELTWLQFLTTYKSKCESIFGNLNSVHVLNTKSAPDINWADNPKQQASLSLNPKDSQNI